MDLYEQNSRLLLLFCEKNFFKMISLFIIFICEDRKKLLSCLYVALYSFVQTKHDLQGGDQF